MKINIAHKFTGKYKGINFEISHHGIGEEYRPEGTWCYYLIIDENQFTEEYLDDFILKPDTDNKYCRLSYNYYDTKIADLDWHGGITFYSKLGGLDGGSLSIKIGCDYAHLYDEGRSYGVDHILCDVERTINKMLDLFPDIKIRSFYYGGFYKRIEGEFNTNGNFVSFEEKERWRKQYGE